MSNKNVREESKEDKIEDFFKLLMDFNGIKGTVDKLGCAVALILCGESVSGYYGNSYIVGFRQCKLIPTGVRTHTYILTSLFFEISIPEYLGALNLQRNEED